MLGSFLEFAIATPQLAQSFDFYRRAGFDSAITNDIWSHPYGVLVRGPLALGLHARLAASPALTFVRPGVAQLALQLDARGIALTTRHLGPESFNQIAFADPGGLAVRVLEARTYSPPADTFADAGPLGEFELLSLPAFDPESALEFWRSLDALVWEREGVDGLQPAVSFGLFHFAFHRPALAAAPLLLFRTDSLAASRAGLAQAAVPASSRELRLPGRHHALLEAPEGTLLLLRETQP